MKIKIRDKNILTVTLLAFIIGALSFGYFIISDGGYFALCDDFNNQMVPFSAAINNHLKSGGGSWVWNTGLGAQTLGAYSYYYLGSPFFWLSMLLPGRLFPYVVGPMYVLKYTAAAVMAYLYLRQYAKVSRHAVLASLLYAFSGFQSINLEFYVFHDIVALFPLLLLGIDLLYKEGRKNLFIFAVFLNCLLNYFFFFGEVIFLIIYVLFMYYSREDSKAFWKTTRSCILYGLTGMGVASPLFIPSAVYIFGNPRSLPDIVKMWHTRCDVLNVIKGYLLPADPMNDQAIIAKDNWKSMSCYIPMLGMSPVVAYVVHNIRRKDRLTRLLLFCFVISFIPVIESAFYIFTAVYYRWWYMMLLVAAVAVIRVLDDREEYPVCRSIIAVLAATIIFVFVFWIGEHMGVDKLMILRHKPFLFLSAISVGSLVYSLIVFSLKKHRENVLFASICLFCLITTAYTILMYRKTSNEKDYIAYFNSGVSLQTIDEQYRYRSIDNILMYPGGANGTGTFNSTISNSVRDFEDLLEFDGKCFNIAPEKIDGLNELLAARYEVVKGDKDVHTYTIKEHPVCPIGYYVSDYVTVDELMSIPLEDRGVAMLKQIVVKDKDVDALAPYLAHNDRFASENDHDMISDCVEKASAGAVTDFKREHNGFSFGTSAESDGVVFLTVPYDWGWRVYTDGQKSKIFNVDGGFMALIVPGGDHSITFRYRSTGLITGIVCFFAGVFGWIIINRRQDKSAEEPS